MFQKEFGQRLSSGTRSKGYGRLSVLTQYMTKVLSLFVVNPESFKPVPAVESIFIKLTPIAGRDINSPTAKKLQEITQIAFSKRRKMLSKSYKDILGREDFNYLNIESSQRPEDLTVEEFVRISDFLIEN
jgi:16S rRNA (adenine1518-N6/adenine1519-N6)-dimethyltransferase